MEFLSVPSSKTAFASISVNGEAWGLYLALEGVEEAFCERNYGSDYGELYKPESDSVGGGDGKDQGDREQKRGMEQRTGKQETDENNLAFAGFQSNSASGAVNLAIDDVVSGASLSDRLIFYQLLQKEEYRQIYESYLQKIVDEYVGSGYLEAKILQMKALIAPYVKEDATVFYTYDEFTAAVDTLLQFTKLWAESVEGQLNGDIPSSKEEQDQNPDALVDASGLTIANMGTQGGGKMGGMKRQTMGKQASGQSVAFEYPWEADEGADTNAGVGTNIDTDTNVDADTNTDAKGVRRLDSGGREEGIEPDSANKAFEETAAEQGKLAPAMAGAGGGRGKDPEPNAIEGENL